MILLFMALFIPIISLAITVDIIQNGKDNFVVKIGREVSALQAMQSVFAHATQLKSHTTAIGVALLGFVVLILPPAILATSKLFIYLGTDLAGFFFPHIARTILR